MNRIDIINRIGSSYITSNIEGGEYSYVQAAGSKEKLINALGRTPEHYKLDIRFEDEDVVVLVETKVNFRKADEKQLQEYLDEEIAVNNSKKIIAILANTGDDKIKVWQGDMENSSLLKFEKVIDTMEHYKNLFVESKQNDREKVLRNTYALNELLHKKDIAEKLRSQFVGTTLLYVKDQIKKQGASEINKFLVERLNNIWRYQSPSQIRTGMKETLDGLLNGSDNKTKKIELLQSNVLNNQKVRQLTLNDWIEILDTIILDIYAYIDTESSEGQDILNLFFIAFNKYTGKADKNQAFTPDHITDFMCRVTNVDRTKRIFDGTCGSGSFLVQAMVKELADCSSMKATEEQKRDWMETVRREHIYGIEVEEVAYGLSTTNMLIHSDGNSNIILADLFKSYEFFKQANPDIILMNPPYNAKPITIPESYKKDWDDKAKKGTTDPTKGLVFIQFISDAIHKMNEERIEKHEQKKEVKLAVLLPVATAIGNGNLITSIKEKLLENNTLEAVFSLPPEIFYPGAAVSACCMVFTLGKPHRNPDGTINQTFFGYYRDDGHKKKKNLGRIEQFDRDDNSLWKTIEEEWLDLFRNRRIVAGKSAMQAVTGEDEWLCEAYMDTDYTQLNDDDFQQTVNNYLAYLVKEGKIYEP